MGVRKSEKGASGTHKASAIYELWLVRDVHGGRLIHEAGVDYGYLVLGARNKALRSLQQLERGLDVAKPVTDI
jgi:hypothetical protein